MKLAWIIWLAPCCRSPPLIRCASARPSISKPATSPIRGQQAVAEVALRRRDSGLWGDTMCDVVTARKQFAPSLVSPRHTPEQCRGVGSGGTVALEAERNWALPDGERKEIVPGASHFMAHAIANPSGAMRIRLP